MIDTRQQKEKRMAKKTNVREEIELEVFPIMFEAQVIIDTLFTEHKITCCTHNSLTELLEDTLTIIKGDK